MPLTDADREVVEFTVTCKMRRRWAQQFLGMLKTMQYLGSVGRSREVTMFADGDGDFRPQFEWTDVVDAEPADPILLMGDRHFFDAD